MAEVAVSFGRDFTLNLPGGRQVHFKKGPQNIDDCFLKHWYVNANRDDLQGSMLDGLRGSQDFLKEDMEMARQLMEEEAASQARMQQLTALRSRANARLIQHTIASMSPTTRKPLTPHQQALVDAADREQAKRQREHLATVPGLGAPKPVVPPKTLPDMAAPLPPPIAPDPEMLALVRQPVGKAAPATESKEPAAKSRRPRIAV